MKKNKTEVLSIYVCDFCGTKHGEHVERCGSCNYPTITKKDVSDTQFCKLFGHDGGEKMVPNSSRLKEKKWNPLVEDGCVVGGGYDYVFSHEYLFKCARCGYTKKTRK